MYYRNSSQFTNPREYRSLNEGTGRYCTGELGFLNYGVLKAKNNSAVFEKWSTTLNYL
jgi:hypothetical protein